MCNRGSCIPYPDTCRLPWCIVTACMHGIRSGFCNISKDAVPVFRIADSVTPPIFMLFFVLSGARLDVSLIPAIGVIGALYIIMRVVGKLCGSWLGSVITKAPEPVKNTWANLIPQAVAIGLTLVVDQVVPEYAGQIRAVVLCATLIYELVGLWYQNLPKRQGKLKGKICLRNIA